MLGIKTLRPLMFMIAMMMGQGALAGSDTSLQLSANHKTHQDWQLRCPDPATAQDQPCEMVHTAAVQVGEKQVPLFVLSLSEHSDPENLYAILFVPHGLNLLLPQAGVMDMDVGIKPVEFAWLNCTELGCWSHQTLNANHIQALRRKKSSQLHLGLSDGRVMDITFSLMGFSKTLEGLQN